MFWPFSPFLVALKKETCGKEPRYHIFPKEHAHGSWVELSLYLGDAFNPEWVECKDISIQDEFHTCGNADTFYHHSERYLYHLTGYFLEGWKRPGYALLFELLAANRHQNVLDYGCGIGADGLWFMENNVQVSFADFDNPSSRYLSWRLAHRTDGGMSRLYDIDCDDIPVHDIVWCTDVLEHLPPRAHVGFLARLGRLGRVVVMNMVDDKRADGLVHHPVDVDMLTAWLQEHGPLGWTDVHRQEDGSKVRFCVYRLSEEHACEV